MLDNEIIVFTDVGERERGTGYVAAKWRALDLARSEGYPIFCFDLNESGAKHFAVCSHDVLWRVMSPELRKSVLNWEKIKNPLCGYEYVLGERPTTLYFDLDGKYDLNPRLRSEEGLRRRMVEQVIEMASRALEASFPEALGGAPVRRDEWIELVSGNEEAKFSRHLVWRRPKVMFATGCAMRDWLRDVLFPRFRDAELLQIMVLHGEQVAVPKCVVDEAVYNFEQSFRMQGMHKCGVRSILKRSPMCQFVPPARPADLLAERVSAEEWMWRLSLVQYAGYHLDRVFVYSNAGSVHSVPSVPAAQVGRQAPRDNVHEGGFSVPTMNEGDLRSQLEHWLLSYHPADSETPPGAAAALLQWREAGVARIVKLGRTGDDSLYAHLPRGNLLCPVTGKTHSHAQVFLTIQRSAGGWSVFAKCFCDQNLKVFLGTMN